MVPVIYEKEKEILESNSLESIFLSAYNKIPFVSFEEFSMRDDLSRVAYDGYSGNKVDQKTIDSIINRPAIRELDYSNNIFKFIGIHLASPEKKEVELQKQYKKRNLKDKFAVTIFFPEFKEQLLKELDSTSDFSKLLNLLFNEESLTDQDEDFIEKRLANNVNVDCIDIILYKLLLKKFTRFKYNQLNAVELIKQVFINFQNAIKHLTVERRKNHDLFHIRDEYDVQDLSYYALKSIFPTLQFENPHFKCGGTYSKVDLMLLEEGIDIELKMIKEKDLDEKEFIKQLKIDINDYATWRNIKDLIVFVYDPYNKTKDKNNFYQLEGRKSINGISFNVHIILSN